jgi:hypothetical protein
MGRALIGRHVVRCDAVLASLL